MLESIKLFLDVAGCSFVLAVDDDVVERGVEHHYRDYIHRNDNFIYVNSDKSQEETSKTDDKISHQNQPHKYQLPITGNEYLEKMISLPFRLPPIESTDIEEFIKSEYKDSDITKNKNEYKELLSFFANSIPPTPRKIKRTIELFKLKRSMIEVLELPINDLLIAKITVLELFAPKLFRYIKSNDIDLFGKIAIWKDDESIKTLYETNQIEQSIKDEKTTQRLYEMYYKILHLIIEVNNSRVRFELDRVFEEFDEELLKEYIKLQKSDKVKDIAEEQKEILAPAVPDEFYEAIMSDDKFAWQKAFSDDSNLSKPNVLLDDESFNKLLNKSKVKFKKDSTIEPEWLEIVSQYLKKEDFKKLLKELNPIQRLLDER
jgi:hypothetical protein